MLSQSFSDQNASSRSQFLQQWGEILILFSLLALALLLYTLDLGGVALRDWDEGIVAQVAREITQADLNWLYPKIQGTPYFNKPPLVHWLISLTYSIAGVHEWTTRLVPAILTATSVPLLYLLGKELFHQRSASLLSACVYLTLLPMVRHGRLAMLDGVVICFFLMMAISVLRSRRDLRYPLITGITFSCLCLTKGVLLGILFAIILIIFLIWDTPRLLTSQFFWGGLLLGSAPMVLWYSAQWFHYGQHFIDANLVHQSLKRIWEPVGNHAGPPWYYVLEILKFSTPWLFFLPQGLQLIWKNRNLSQGKFLLTWLGIYGGTISLMNTKLPWYVLPLYPALALIIGYQLNNILQQSPLNLGEIFSRRQISVSNGYEPDRVPAPPITSPNSSSAYPLIITLLFYLLATLAWSLLIILWIDVFPQWQLNSIFDTYLTITLVFLALTFTGVGWLFRENDPQFIPVLIWGLYLSLLFFITSPHWVWELGEDYPVKPVATIVKSYTPPGQQVYTSHKFPRPSLNFYSDRAVKTAKDQELQQLWQQTPAPYFLLDSDSFARLNLEQVKVLAMSEGWYLVTRDPHHNFDRRGIEKTDHLRNFSVSG